MLRSLSCFVALAALAPATPAAEYAWSTGTSGTWADATRWSLGGVPGAADNATIAAPGTYAVTMAGSESINNVTLNNATTTVNCNTSSATFTLGGTMTLTAGTWIMGGLNGSPQTMLGGTVTRGAGGVGRLQIEGDLRFQNTVVQGEALRFTTGGSLIRMAGTARFTAGSVVTFSPTLTHADFTGIVWEQNTVVDNVTINTGANVRVGLSAGTSLTFGPNVTLVHNDANFSGLGVVGRHLSLGNPSAFTFTNQGTIRDVSGSLAIGKEFTTNNNGDPLVTVVNSGLIESRFDTSIFATNFTNQAGGVVRATAGGGLFVFSRGNWTNLGTFDVGGSDSTFTMGGLFRRSGIGAITRTGANTVGFYAARIDNTNDTLALSAATGNYVLYADSVTSGAEIVGGSLSASGGAKLEVRVYPGAYSGFDYAFLTDVSVGTGVLSFATTGGKVITRGTTTFTAGETINLVGVDTQLAFAQTRQVDDLTVVLAGNQSSLAAIDGNTLTLGPTSTVRKTGAGTASFKTPNIFTQNLGTLVNLGTVSVEAGTLDAAQATFTNRGLVDIAAGAGWAGALKSGAGGTVRGAGSVAGGLTFTGAGTSLRPGSAAAPGRLTVSDTGVTLTSGTTLTLRLNGPTAGSGHDQLAVSGTVTLGGAVLAATVGGGYTPAAGDRLFLVTNDGTDAVSGTFAGLADGSTVNVGAFTATIRYTGDSGSLAITGGNDIVLTGFAPVPEPVVVLPVAILGLWALRRSRR